MRTVFFGDGTFPTRGVAPVPRKKLVHRLAVRTVTALLDEYRTSKMCPCGADELTDGEGGVTGGERVRVHKTIGGACAVLAGVRDRDELATVNMLLAAQSALRQMRWPLHLCRSCS